MFVTEFEKLYLVHIKLENGVKFNMSNVRWTLTVVRRVTKY